MDPSLAHMKDTCHAPEFHRPGYFSSPRGSAATWSVADRIMTCRGGARGGPARGHAPGFRRRRGYQTDAGRPDRNGPGGHLAARRRAAARRGECGLRRSARSRRVFQRAKRLACPGISSSARASPASRWRRRPASRGSSGKGGRQARTAGRCVTPAIGCAARRQPAATGGGCSSAAADRAAGRRAGGERLWGERDGPDGPKPARRAA